MRLLQYGNRKMAPIAWDISTPELELQAFLELFQYFDGDYWQMYSVDPLYGTQKKLYLRAKDGDAGAARKLLELRQKYEYEDWQILEIQTETNKWNRSKVEQMFHQRDVELRG
jgi:hypothetical protein